MTPLKRICTMLIILLAAAIYANAVFAHSRVDVGEYSLIVGWVEEPVIVGERNALFLQVLQGETPINGVEGTLEVELSYAGRSFFGNIEPSGDAGIYHVPVFPTVRGQYQVLLTGAIQDTPIDVTIDPEEVLAASALQFPQPLPDSIALANEIEQLQTDLNSARAMAIAGIVAGIVGVLTGVFAIIRSGQTK